MQEKPVPIKKKAYKGKSPYSMAWPQIELQARIQDKPEEVAKAETKKEKTPDLLFHKQSKKQDLGVTLLNGKATSIKMIHVVIFAALLLVLVIPFQLHAYINGLVGDKNVITENVIEAGTLWQDGYTALRAGNLEVAEGSFTRAKQLFIATAAYPRKEHPLLVSMLEVSPVKSKRYIAFKNGITSGFLISETGESLVRDAVTIQNGESIERERVLEHFEDTIHLATKNILEAHFLISRIDVEVLPENVQADFTTLRTTFDETVVTINKVDTIVSLLGSMAGFNDPKLWMFVFQNSAELRASGGFMGSFGIAKADEGKLEIVDIPGGGTYDLRGSFRKNVIAPEPLHLINPIWEFQDSNWWPDWPTSAKKIIWFYEQGNGATVDGVLSFTPSFLERVLDITGPVELDEYRFTIDKYNAYDFLQTLSERKLDVTNKPKKVIADLAHTIIEESETLFKPEDTISLLSLIVDSVEQRQLLVYWNTEEGQDILAENNWDGALVDSDTDDYFMVVHTNIAGGKSDRSIRDVVSIDSIIQDDGRVKNTATLTRTHHSKEGTGFSGVRNVDYIRFYVPEGSELISSKGFNKPDEALFEEPPEGWVFDEDYLAYETDKGYDEVSKTEQFSSFGKKVFANWLMVDPGESRTVTIEYYLPSKIVAMPDEYTFYIQKQSGWQGAQLQYNLSWPDDWNPGLVNGASPGNASSVSYDSHISKDIQLKTKWENNTYAKK